jgi:large subunit ribosomal protein L15
MTLSLNTLKPAPGSRSKKFRVGRGEGSGSGKTAGRGTKGQRSRSGGRNKLKTLGMRQLLLSMPKLRGFQSRYLKPSTVKLEAVAKAFGADMKIDVKALKAKGLVPKITTRAKLVGTADLDKPLNFVNVLASATAKAAVEKAGGSFVVPKRKKAKARK